MAAFALADALPDFGSRGHRPTASAPAAKPEPVTSTGPAVADPSSAIAEAVAKAEAAVADQLSSIYEATLQAERDNHAAERDQLQRSLGSEAAALIEARFAELERQLVELTTTAAARILGAVLSDTMQARSVEALASTIREAVHDSDAVRIRVYGPQSLFEALSGALGDLAGNVEFSERPSLDLTLSIDSNLYETRLAEWSAAVAGVVV
jgi:type VI protein secretion system component VasK